MKMGVVLSGRILEGIYVSKTHKCGMQFTYKVHIPACCEGRDECALLVTHDGLNAVNAYAIEVLEKTGEAPPCITVGVDPATQPSELAWGRERDRRIDSYDYFTAAYPDFIVEELIPFLTETYGLKISSNPDMHMASGGSSGGISAWNMAWQRNDYFRRVYMSSPTFSAMGNGNSYPVLIRKTETKPIRVYEEYSEDEPNDYFGCSYCAALEGERALAFAGYDMTCKYFPGEDHCSRRKHLESAIERMRVLWKDWQTQPIVVKALSKRAAKIISKDEPWEEIDAPFPPKVPCVLPKMHGVRGEYLFSNREIFLQTEQGRRVVADGFQSVSAIAISADKCRLYIADRMAGCVYRMEITKDGGLKGKHIQSVLHLSTDFKTPGATDLCVDDGDRIFAATELGVQAIRSYGLIDVILPLPDRCIPEHVAFGESDPDYLYAYAKGRVFRRHLVQGHAADPEEATEPRNDNYY